MKKTFSMIVLIVVLLSTVSAHTDVDFRVSEGMKAPRFEVKGVDGLTVSPSDMKGRFVIVNFWSSTDADSRIAVDLYNNYVDAQPSGKISLVSINIDSDKKLIGEIMRRDRLNVNSQYTFDAGQSQDIIRRNNLDRGVNSYLVSPEGRIVAVNPSLSTIRTFVK